MMERAGEVDGVTGRGGGRGLVGVGAGARQHSGYARLLVVALGRVLHQRADGLGRGAPRRQVLVGEVGELRADEHLREGQGVVLVRVLPQVARGRAGAVGAVAAVGEADLPTVVARWHRVDAALVVLGAPGGGWLHGTAV